MSKQLPLPGLRWARTGRLTGRPWEIVRITDDARVMLLDETSWILAESVVEWGSPIDPRPVTVALPESWSYEIDDRFDCVHYRGLSDVGAGAMLEITIFKTGIVDDLPKLRLQACTLQTILTFHLQRKPLG